MDFEQNCKIVTDYIANRVHIQFEQKLKKLFVVLKIDGGILKIESRIHKVDDKIKNSMSVQS